MKLNYRHHFYIVIMDDSLNFQFKEADLQLYVDTNRYKLRNLVSFLKERAGVLRLQTKSPFKLHILAILS